jgi:hypothetical protein
MHGAADGTVPTQVVGTGVGELTALDAPVEVGMPAGVVPVGEALAGVLPAGERLAVTVRVRVLVGRAPPAETVRVTIWVAVTVLAGPATVVVTVTAGRGRTGRVTGSAIEWVEAAGSEWPAPPITMPPTSPAAAASVTGRRDQFREGSVPNMAS